MKQQGGKKSHTISEVEVPASRKTCRNSSKSTWLKVEVGQIVHLSDIKPPKGVELVALAHGNDLAVANIHASRVKDESAE